MTHAVIISADELDRWRQQIVQDVVRGVGEVLTLAGTERAVDRKQMADLLGVGIATIDRLVNQGAIPSLVMNSRRAFLPSQVYAALQADEAA